MVYVGVTLFLIGALAQLRDYLAGAWPASLTWILMAVGILLTLTGLTPVHTKWRKIAYGALGLLVLGVAVAWLVG